MNDDVNPDEVIEEIASILDMDEAAVDALKLSIMETHEKAATLLEKVADLGHPFSTRDADDNIFVNAAWLATILLLEADQTMRGHGGCPDHMRVIDLIETTIVAATKNLEDK